VITFDELVARAEWHVESAAHDSGSGGRRVDAADELR
jgi:hypothetical protein